MELKEYFDNQPRGAKKKVADQLGITTIWLGMLIHKRKKASAKLCKELEKYTNGAVTRKDIRPDIFGD